MLLLRRFCPYILGTITVFGFLIILAAPILIWPLLVFLSLLIIAAVFLLTDAQFGAGFFSSLITPLFLFLSGFAFNLFLESQIIKIVIAAFIGFLIFIYTEHLFYRGYLEKRYREGALENLCFYFTVLSVFLFSASLFGFYIFLHAPKSLLLAIIAALLLILNYQLFRALKVNFWESWPYNLVLTLTAFEFFYVLMLLPTAFAVSGAMLAILYYFTAGLLRYHFSHELDARMVRRYVLIGGLIFLLVAATARWT